MKKVILVDDEPFIIDMLMALIDWNDIGLKCAGIANNGVEAVKLIGDVEPEIVITDIRLPGIDGLGIIKSCYERGSSAKFIIVSGYKQFEYAQTAMNYGVTEYLLKPIQKKELNKALQKISDEIENQHILHEKQEKSKKELIKGKAALRDNLADAILMGGFFPNSYNEINREYLLNFREGLYETVFFKIDCPGEKPDVVLLDTIKKQFYSSFICEGMKKCFEGIYREQTHGYFVIFNFPENILDSFLLEQKSAIDELKKYASMFKDTKVTLAHGEIKTSLYDAVLETERCRKILIERIKPGMPAFMGEKYFPDKKYEFQISSALLRAVRNSVISRDTYALERAVLSIYTEMEIGQWNGATARSVSVAIAKAVDTFLLEEKFLFEIDWRKREGELEKLLDGCGTYTRLKHEMAHQLVKYFEGIIENETTDSYAVRMAKQYIAQNYMKKIKLQDVADIVFLNPVYLSICFKQEVRCNFVDYVNEYRIEKAKELLVESQETVYSICEQVGLPDTRYFSKLFKRYVGLTPNEYRNSTLRKK